ncbi:MAG: glycoside hydrolase family 3 C-terminal domain-containing protein [Prolixibacteraceae bacterium]|nr:glycoside hydrolase family 3 C-terminal domain-containing protein [Prolixibacteraceae bacterium]
MRNFTIIIKVLLFSFTILSCSPGEKENTFEKKADKLLQKMTLDEKIGQLVQKNGGSFSDSLVKAGGIGSVLNEISVERQNHIQRIAMEDSRLGIPILFARDVIHGFNTIMPIPLAQAATWNPALIEQGARVAATEAASSGIKWTFSPMIDITRDPRWGRIAECLGEDSYLTSEMGAAMVRGYQGDKLSDKTSIAACVKHFAAYGWAEGGRDYNTANIPENDLRDIVLPPFKRCAAEGALSFMTSFNDINGVPATGNEFLVKDILRNEWDYTGMVVSDWVSIIQMVTHGFAPDEKASALLAMNATVDMEMASTSYETYLKELLDEGSISQKQIDNAVRRILTVKYKLGLFESPYTNPDDFPEPLNNEHLAVSKKAAIESAVLLKNDGILPVSEKIKTVAVIGPLADAPHDQLGTWIFDGSKNNSVTPLESLSEKAKSNGITLLYERGLKISRSKEISFPEKVKSISKQADLIILFLGEESILSGESHCRADIDLPGAQEELVNMVTASGKPVIAVFMAGRPLTVENVIEKTNAALYAWHPGTMAGPALTDLLWGAVSPSGKLPVTFPRHVGQIPIYYSHRTTGKPATNETWEHIDDIPVEAPQLSIGNTSHYLDYGFEPMFPFGYGLSYTTFEYQSIETDKTAYSATDTIQVSVKLINTGNYNAAEVVQLYVHDKVASRAPAVKQLKGFKKVFLKQGEKKTVIFNLPVSSLGFHNLAMKYMVEPGEFEIMAGGSSDTTLETGIVIEN